MKWFTLLSSVILLIIIMFPCGIYNFTLYVESGESSTGPSCTCPEDESKLCGTLDFYINFSNTSFLDSFNDLTLVFLCGQHTYTQSSNATISFNVSRLQSLSVQGDGSNPECVVVHDVTFEFANVPKLHLTNITIRDVTIKVSLRGLSHCDSFKIVNTNIDRSNCQIVGYNLTLENSTITNSINTAFHLVSSSLTLAGNVVFSGNSGVKGGALALTESSLNISRHANITFSDNSVSGKGGAIYVNNPSEVLKVFPTSDCFYGLHNYDKNATYKITFTGNNATRGGSHIFGSSLKSFCTAARNESDLKQPSYEVISSQKIFHFENPELSDNTTDSAVSDRPARVCICDENDSPHCLDDSKIFMSKHLYRGEVFTLSLILVGGDFGTTVGVIQAQLELLDPLQPNQDIYLSCNQRDRKHFKDTERKSNLCYDFVKSRKTCTKLQYVINSTTTSKLILQLFTTNSDILRFKDQIYIDNVRKAIERYKNDKVIEKSLIFTPLFIDITLNKSCPLGFHLDENTHGCDCYPSIKDIHKDLKCQLENNSGYLSHLNVWIGMDPNTREVVMSRHCPHSVCHKNLSKLQIDLDNTLSINKQCAFNHAGRFCGDCMKGYSLAIGTSHCIKCSNNNNLALLIFFAAAGVLLVIFITSMNLTVTPGLINGVIFYANILWVYNSVILPNESTGLMLFLRVFLAWLNLDFGIEACFVVRLNAFWKTLLQYLFPLYIWSIVGVIILGARYSTRLTKLLGSQTVSVLSTLTLLSYMKLLRNAVESFKYANLDYFNTKEKVGTLLVWALDGRLEYCHYPHVFLFLAALIVFCLCTPFTLVLFFGQWLREIPYFTRFHPIFDSYFASIKNKHHYWPGMLLFVRAFLYLMNLTLFQRQAIFALLITVIVLQTYMSVVQPQRSGVNFFLDSAFLVNLIILSASILFVSEQSDKGLQSEHTLEHRKIIAIVSITIAFVEFCIIVFLSFLKSAPYSRLRSYFGKAKYRKSVLRRRPADKVEVEVSTVVSYAKLRESILDDLPE